MAKSGFSGGKKLKAYLRKLSKKVNKAKSVQVGFLKGATYPDGTPVPLVAALNEFGVPAHNQPPRPFFRTMIAEKSPKWGKSLGKALKQSDYDAQQALALMGEGISGQLQASIQEFTSPGLAESTKQAKGFDKPLIDTGHMIQSVHYVVKK